MNRTAPAGSRLAAMVQHPRCLFAYWEVGEKDLARLEEALNTARKALPFALRLFHLGAPGDGPQRDAFQTIPVDLDAGKHYIHPVAPGRLYWLELGVPAGEAGFVRLLRSDIVETPPDAPAEAPARGLPEASTPAYSPLAGAYAAVPGTVVAASRPAGRDR